MGLGQALGDAESVTPGLSPGDVVGLHLLGCAFELAVRCELFPGLTPCVGWGLADVMPACLIAHEEPRWPVGAAGKPMFVGRCGSTQNNRARAEAKVPQGTRRR